MENEKILRILDANFNRLREGLRVIEEVERLANNDENTFHQLKTLRHDLAECCRLIPRDILLAARGSEHDVGRGRICASEAERKDLTALSAANFKRCQEAARVIEEFAKLTYPAVAEKAKKIRFSLYDLEKLFL